jgi:hypothetical protein
VPLKRCGATSPVCVNYAETVLPMRDGLKLKDFLPSRRIR